MGDKRQRPCAKGASSGHGKGQEFYNDGGRDPAIDAGACLTRIVGHHQSVVTSQRRFHDSPDKQQNGDLRSSVLAERRRSILAAGDYRIVTDEELIEGLSFPVYRRVVTMILVPAESGSASTVEMVTIDPRDLQAAQELDLNHGA
jgi:hypothetical protein